MSLQKQPLLISNILEWITITTLNHSLWEERMTNRKSIKESTRYLNMKTELKLSKQGLFGLDCVYYYTLYLKLITNS